MAPSFCSKRLTSSRKKIKARKQNFFSYTQTQKSFLHYGQIQKSKLNAKLLVISAIPKKTDNCKAFCITRKHKIYISLFVFLPQNNFQKQLFWKNILFSKYQTFMYNSEFYGENFQKLHSFWNYTRFLFMSNSFISNCTRFYKMIKPIQYW